ncbi:hypothetical protein [Paraferrimonas sedimenticola]|uniref:DUF4178 domain-containing protein n=1 Tax=Paraferrimonas sedimenticola TaxID=375674 RepID=A0AA37RUS5_9GAMM|nr:hypothetical protein [Paraferrimonas sedimenticola]GLP95676.1 hypothetical protein GCM10007895_09820 [Paraferrimonas sedimenticola]
MGFFDKLFGKKAEAEPRQLNHPSQLNQGDMIVLDDSFALPGLLRGQQFKVESVNCYEYQNSRAPEWILRGNGQHTLFLSIEQDDEEYLAVSIKLTRAEVESCFDMDAFADIFEEGVFAELEGHEQDGELAGWLNGRYRQTDFAEFGYFHRADYRHTRPPQDANQSHGDAFEAYQLVNDNETHAIDIEVYENGETDVMLTLYRPVSDIREYWPA